MHKIRLVNATFFAHHGVTPEERQTGGRYEVDVEVKFNFEVAAQKDDLDESVCYEMIYRIAERIIQEESYKLIERIALYIGNEVAELSTQIEYVDVYVRKRNPPIGGVVDYTEVVYRTEAVKT